MASSVGALNKAEVYSGSNPDASTMTEEQKRQQVIHENNVLRKQIRQVLNDNLTIRSENVRVKANYTAANVEAQKVRHAALASLQTGQLERIYAAGGLENVRLYLQTSFGWDGLSQADIDCSL